MRRTELTRTQLEWIVLALQHEMVRVKEEMESADEGSPLISLGSIVLDTRQVLINKLEDVIHSQNKTISIV